MRVMNDLKAGTVALNSTEEIIEDLRAGKMVIVMDDEDRENEGDLVMAAQCVRPEDINFMARYGRGLICLTLTRERCQQLRLPLMVQDNLASHTTAFTVSIEAARGVTTGISAADRAVTVQAAVKADAVPEDIVQPGHVFPLMARPGGVLTRAGHTEAGCDLARFAGFEPASVIVEILNEDGTMARRPDLELFAREHDLKIGTIEDLIRYRVQNEKTVERVAESPFPTEFGEFRLVAYRDRIDGQDHLALVRGEPAGDHPTLVRVHVQNTLCDVLGGTLGRGWPLRDAMRRVAQEGEGVVVVIREPEDLAHDVQHVEQLQAQASQPRQRDDSDRPQTLRTYGIGAQILHDLGVRKMRILSAPKIMHGLGGFDLEVVEYVSS